MFISIKFLNFDFVLFFQDCTNVATLSIDIDFIFIFVCNDNNINIDNAFTIQNNNKSKFIRDIDNTHNKPIDIKQASSSISVDVTSSLAVDSTLPTSNQCKLIFLEFAVDINLHFQQHQLLLIKHHLNLLHNNNNNHRQIRTMRCQSGLMLQTNNSIDQVS